MPEFGLSPEEMGIIGDEAITQESKRQPELFAPDSTTDAPIQPSQVRYERDDKTGMVQRYRGKQNVIYRDPTGNKLFAKYVSQRPDIQRDDIAGMRQEKIILDYLRPTGVVPQSGELKIYPNEQRARLLLEKVDGASLDRPELREDLLSRHELEPAIRSTAHSLEIIHAQGVLLGDVNPGSFIVNEQDGQFETKVVDFEHAHVIDQASGEEIERLAQWYRAKDFGARHLEAGTDQLDQIEMLRKSEMHLWGWTMAEFALGDSFLWPEVELTAEQLQGVQDIERDFGPSLQQEIVEKAKESYARYEATDPDSYWAKNGGEEAYIQSEINTEYKYALLRATAGVTFAARTKQAGIDLHEEVVEFISSTLSPYPQQRPSNFMSF